MAESARYDGWTADDLRALLGVPRVELHVRVSSTLDVAHALAAADAPAGTLVLADEQTAGRGRGGRAWASAPGAGIWLTVLERPRDPGTVEPLSLRLGLRAAAVLDRYTGAPVRLKWPNDVHLGSGKLGGVLIETRWRNEQPDWVAIGFGLNVRLPDGMPGAAALGPGVDRVALLGELVPALRGAARSAGALSAEELGAFSARDFALGRRCRAPTPGIVRGIDARGSLLVATGTGVMAFRTGSLVLEDLV